MYQDIKIYLQKIRGHDHGIIRAKFGNSYSILVELLPDMLLTYHNRSAIVNLNNGPQI